jgi:HlyD family secretion protein
MTAKRIIPIVLIIIAAAGVWLWMSRDTEDPDWLAVTGTVEATEARLGFQTPGRIETIHVAEGDLVQQGALIAELDVAEIRERRGQAEARLAATRSLLEEMQRGSRPEEIAQAEAAVSAASEQLQDARRDLARNRTLFEGGAISREMLEKSGSAATIAEKNLNQAREQLALVRSGVRRERIEAQSSHVAEAEAAIRGVDAAIANYRITAPFSGIVTVRHREPNEIVAPGQPVVTLMNPDDRWARIYVPENRIGGIHHGSTTVIRSDTYPQKTYSGSVTHVASEAEFTPKNVQTTEERVRLVYAVKVRIEGDPAMELKPGMPVDVEVPFGSEVAGADR